MKLFEKLAKDHLMTQPGYDKGDFTLQFVSLWGQTSKSNKSANSVFVSFEIFDLNGVRECVHAVKLFDFGFVTPKGYKSTKMVPVVIADWENLTMEDVKNLLPYKAEYKLNTFDPFFHENEAKRRNAAGWNYVAQHFITDPYDTN